MTDAPHTVEQCDKDAADRAVNGLNTFQPAPAYTASLDAAMTLVPHGLRWFVSNVGREGTPEASVTLPNGGWLVTVAATPALALCAAALRASQKGQ